MTKQQLASKIWDAANEMRSSKIEANDYKDYLLGFIFYRFLSDQEVKFFYEKGGTEEELKSIKEDDTRAEYIRKNLGYFIEYENLFNTWREMKKDFKTTNVTDALSAFERNINKNKPEHRTMYKDIFKILSQGIDKFGDDKQSPAAAIQNLLDLVTTIPMDGKEDYDVLGFVYEYLIGNFAANAGKKAGEYYTPHEVSVLMSEIVANHLKDKKEIKIYDSTCGSGSLLINIGKSVEKYLNNKNGIVYYAQDNSPSAFNLARMNLIMRGIDPANIHIRQCDSTLDKNDWPIFDEDDPENTYEPLTNIDAVVGNPPYSQKWTPIEDKRYDGYGIAPKSKADYAFLLHDLYHLRPGGIMAIVLPHGVLFRGGDEAEIRRNLVDKNNIDAIIGLPANIFYGTGIPTIIMVLKKGRPEDDVLIIDASKGFIKDGKKNRLRERDIKKIVDTYIGRLNIDKFSRRVSREEIRNNDYNLNIPRYVDSSEAPETYDLYATINGGIPKSEIALMGGELKSFASLNDELFKESTTPYVSLKCEADSIRETIENNKDVKAYEQEYCNAFSGFEDFLYNELIDKVNSIHVAAEEEVISAELFKRLEKIALVDKYEVYQLFDDKWGTISGDIEIIQNEGLSDSCRQVDPNMVTKTKDSKKIETQDGWLGHVIPFELVQKDYFPEILREISEKQDRQNEIAAEEEEIKESMSEEVKEDLLTEDEKFDKKEIGATAKAALRENDPDMEEDSKEAVSISLNKLFTEESALKKEITALEGELVKQTLEVYKHLTEEEIKKYLKEKWIDPLMEEILSIPTTIVSNIEKQVINLNKKYETTMDEIEEEIKKTEKELGEMISELEGDEYDMKALEDLKKLIGMNK
ncbi:MAG: type I restriction-modification system subunit M [Prevotella sp.]|nr:type I restriction-modification system subunit M [Prevotella sp.]